MIVEPSRTISPPKLEISREFTEWIDSLNNWQLIGLETMTIWMKSTMSAYGVLESVATAGEVQKAAYLEEITQMQYNGEVDEKLMEINSIKLMVSCGEMMFCFGHNDIK